jgi:hypothetical protein
MRGEGEGEGESKRRERREKGERHNDEHRSIVIVK